MRSTRILFLQGHHLLQGDGELGSLLQDRPWPTNAPACVCSGESATWLLREIGTRTFAPLAPPNATAILSWARSKRFKAMRDHFDRARF